MHAKLDLFCSLRMTEFRFYIHTDIIKLSEKNSSGFSFTLKLKILYYLKINGKLKYI